MNRRRTALLAGSCAVMLGVTAAPAAAVVHYDMKIWMMPPMDVSSAGSCLTQRWHAANGHALDWNHNCGYGSSANVYFRTRALSEDDPEILLLPWAQGEPYQLANQPCGTGTVREARVAVRSTWDGLVKGRMLYAHAQVSTTTAVDILFQGGPNYWDYSWFNSFDIADTKSDAGAGSSCWTGYHVHENNVTSSAWDGFSSQWATAPTSASYDNDYIGNWTRSLTWVDD